MRFPRGGASCPIAAGKKAFPDAAFASIPVLPYRISKNGWSVPVPRILSDADVAAFRERLCEAAARLFVERGRQGFHMRELASQLGVSAMMPYRYFKDRDEILSVVRARAFRRFADQLEIAHATEGPPWSKAPRWDAPMFSSRWKSRPITA